ncbi:MAG: hypothetical protein A3D52_01240 [Candidatus Taylorbacteria bacterium RIFCSPHIGHO2_02_FULL_44_36]|uniref:histidine kinase n=1 Tax=Candidatus Taylorbacteria bacterium RIFCSPLOWO2_12_FULL_44_15c TaxID=1802333 RepID=A0A1G2P7H1_9BACT|nr:MAG: hypothetical protein A3D52_01240 [Candidatus Taylorbacteria bacterium RIFCSPHIGHO2_02_FULL_44_36]OHA38884.1 MAG: hypothetical protein A3I97_01360 [Candidatus Taylorbacteria bacterium RIFCSPLOWO2_02_FULL_44_35]OHA43669.1 MAG: hypothetical protein A3G03_03415 [Candidatus Taylorbacteria bacterium RIFCSPLOWO2_12_FULL_44_15c]
MNAELFITNIGFVFSISVCLGLGILVFIRRPKGASSNVVFFLASIATGIWQISYVIGINLHDPRASQIAFMFNLATLFLVVLYTHLILSVTGRAQSHKRMLTILYIIAAGLVLFFALFPNYLLQPSQPKLYLPNFFVPGSLYALQDAFFFIVLIYLLFQLYISYHQADYRTRNQLKYFIVAYLFGFGVALVPEFLLYGINIDPFISSLTGLYTIPVAYAIIRYDIININLLAKRAFGYSLSVTGITLFIILIGYTNDIVAQIFPNFPQWLMPFASAIIAVTIGVFVWRKIKEVDVLKYQFVDIVTHKFRTPLTYIRWSLNTLRGESKPEEREHAMAAIAEANVGLFELTDMLIGLSESEKSRFLYSYSKESLRSIVNETIIAVTNRIQEKRVSIQANIPETLPKIFVDRKRMQFAVQAVLENAIIYSKPNGQIILNIESKKKFVILSIRDFGIGISKEDMPRIFSKFFRGANAKHTHTEGLGISLHISLDIMRYHGGDIWVESAGLGNGATFFLKIPTAK